MSKSVATRRGSSIAFMGASILAIAIAGPATAQEEAATDEIFVTGSRIATDNVTDSASPVLAIGGDDIATAGQIDVTELLRETPALQGSLPGNFSAFNGADTEDSDLGIGFLNLRSLGIERTLVLQNGRRHVPGSSGQAAVDVNTIPVSMLDRVEVLTGGASSIYGADAVSGVVNFVLRDGDDFDGLEVRAQGGISDEGDAEEAFLSVATGFSFDDDRGSAVIGVEYTRNEAVFSRDRPFAGSGQAVFVPNTAALSSALGVNPNASNTFSPNVTLPVSSRFGIINLVDTTNPATPFASAFFGVLDLPGDGTVPNSPGTNNPSLQVFDNGVLRPYNAGDIFIDPFNAVGGDAIGVLPDVELLLPEGDRFVVNANGKYEINRHINFFLETKFAFSDTIDSVQVNGFNDDIPIALDNPFIPAALQSQIDAIVGAGGAPELAVSRDTLDIATLPSPNVERTTFRVVGGLQGDITDNIQYELSYNYGRTNVDVTNRNTRIEDRFFAAIDSVRDPDTGDIVCRSTLDSSAIPPVSPFPQPPSGFLTFQPGDGQCQPINIFGENAISGPGAQFAFIDTFETTVVTQEVLLATVAGDTTGFLTLPAGPIGWAIGAEYRNETSRYRPDSLDTAGLTFGAVSGGSTLPSSGSIEVWEGFFEGRVPLFADLPFVQLLEASGSVRVSDYDTIGSTVAWTAGGRWALSDDVTLRGTYSIAVRAPNIGELFSPQQPATLGADQDPCNPQFINAGTQFRPDNCALLVPPGYNSTDFNSAFVPGRSGGNPDLNEEQATTITAGIILTPATLLPGLRIIADFYDIKINGAIDSLGAFDIAQACVDLPTLNNQFCDQIFRDPTDRNITGFVSGQINLGALETRGIDWSITYDTEVPTFGRSEDFGSLRLSAIGTKFLRYNEFQDPTDLSVFENRLGEFAIPRWIVNFGSAWTLDKFELAWAGRFESSQLLPGVDNSDLASDPLFVDPTNTGSAFVHDFNVSYTFTEKLEVYGGINNAFDRDPFLGTVSRPAGPRGRFFFVGVQAEF